MYKKIAYGIVQDILKEVVASGRDRIMTLLDVDNEESIAVTISKEGKDQLHIITTPDGGEERHTSRKINSEDSAFWSTVDEIKYYVRIGAFYDDENTKELIRIWVEADVAGCKKSRSYHALVGTGEILNSDDLTIWEPQL